MTTLIDPNDPALQPIAPPTLPLAGKKALVVGVANKDSIAYGCARAFRAFGAEVAMTYLNERTRPHTQPLAEALQVPEDLYLPCDVREPSQVEAVFKAVEAHWGKLNILLHSIAFSPRDDLHGRVTDCSLDGFLSTMEVSVWSFIRMMRLAEPLLEKEGGAAFTVSYFGGEKVVPHYGIMGPAKSALETSARYMAAELGPKGIRVNIISPGPVLTRAASGIDRFDDLLARTKERAPTHSLVTPDQVGMATAALACDFAQIITGEVLYMDGGYNIMAG